MKFPVMYSYEVLVLIVCHVFPIARLRGYDNRCEEYRGCANVGHNGEHCANWLLVNKWGDDQFITKDKAQRNGKRHLTIYDYMISIKP